MTDRLVTGPAGRAVAAAVAAALREHGLAEHAGPPRAVQPRRQAVGDFVVDFPQAPGWRPSRTEGRELAAAAATAPGIAEAVAVPPRLYVRATPDLLAGAVLPAVRAGGYGTTPATGQRVVVTFSDPNLNKPLHLGHLRNNLVGMSVAALLASRGHDVRRHVMHSDWGIHICQALVGHLRGGGTETPEAAGLKPDHFVGRQYVRFHEEMDAERAARPPGAPDEETAVEREAYELLRRMENGDDALRAEAIRLTDWVEAGMLATYRRVGTRPDVVISERDCLPLARAAIEERIATGVCAVRPDGSVYADLSAEGLAELTLLRRDGTALVYTQWLGVDLYRAEHHDSDRVVQVSGREWELGEVLYTALRRRFGYDWIDRWKIIHYGMVRLAGAKMKSRTGEAVRVDGFVDRTVETLRARTPDVPADVVEQLAVAAVKLFFLSVARERDIDYDDERFARALPDLGTVVGVVARGRTAVGDGPAEVDRALVPLLLKLEDYPRIVTVAAEQLEPARVAAYANELAGLAARARAALDAHPPIARATADVLVAALGLLNAELPEPDRMPAPAVLAAMFGGRDA